MVPVTMLGLPIDLQIQDLSLADSETEIQQSPDEVFRAAVGFEIALGIFAILLGWSIGPDARQFVPEINPETAAAIAKSIGYGALAAIPIYLAMEIVRRIPCEPVRALERLSEDGMFLALLKLGPLELILISICAGVGEELLFRGWLMYFLAGIGGEPSMVELGAALVASSIAFGLVHPITKLYVFLAAVMGLYFGGLLIYTENLLVPITAHAVYDAIQLLIGRRQARKEKLVAAS